MGTARRVFAAQSRGHHAGVDGGRFLLIPGAAIIAEYLDEAHGLEAGERRLLPASMAERVEVRRLMAWFNEKFFEEVSNPLVTERIYKRFMSEENGGGPALDRRDPRGQGQCALSSGLYRLAVADAGISSPATG